MPNQTSTHTTVLLHETIEGLALQSHAILLDGTIGGGGHSAWAAQHLRGQVTIIGLDRDAEALKRSEARLRTLPHNPDKLILQQESFRHLDRVLEGAGIKEVDGIIFDLGFSSDQLKAGRGFSFKEDEPLLMTLKDNPGEEDLTAEKLLNNFSEDAIELILRGFGEERYSRRIAQAIVESRGERPFKTTRDLVEVVEQAVPASYKHSRIHPATRTFQAIRIAVNEELIALEEGLEKGFESLAPEGRFAIISFHSLEDRMVKNFFRAQAEAGRATLITKKPITPSEEEVQANPRARSAKLRILQKTHNL